MGKLDQFCVIVDATKEIGILYDDQHGGIIDQAVQFFRARVESDAKLQMVRTWYVYTDDPAWRDLMWYHLLMRKVGDHYEAVLPGKMPDAFMVEVGDIALGYPGYVSSTPRKLTDAPVVERQSRGSRPRLWEPN